MKRLIVNADDLGHAPGVNRGILDAHLAGIVTSTTVMINYPDAPEGLERARSDAPDLGIGLHLNVTAGKPVSAPHNVPTLVAEDGRFYPPEAWAARLDRIDPDDIRREIEAQFSRFMALMGRAPDHLDAHHHMTYLHPAGLRAMIDLSDQYAIPMRSAQIAASEDDAVRALKGVLRGMSDDGARRLIAELHAAIAEHDHSFWPARFEMGFYGERATLGDLLVILTTLPDDSLTEIMCHPGYPDEGLVNSGYRERRADELKHLTHPATRECITAEGITLVTFGELAAKG